MNGNNQRIGTLGRILYLIWMTWVFGIFPVANLSAQQARIPGFYGKTPAALPRVPSHMTPRHPDIDPRLNVRQSVPDGSADLQYGNNRLDVYQNRDRVVLDWNTFNIGKDAETQFHQSGGSALNRIHDQHPSQIYGKLTADGSVYLINQNGLIFGAGSKVNVHTLIAASLEPEGILDENNALVDWRDTFSGTDANGMISNHGSIQAKTGGGIYLLGPEVENFGKIEAPSGQVALAAGSDIELTTLEAENRLFPYVYVQPGAKGNVTNAESGRITADSGIAGLYGRVVNQEGYIRSVTAITNNGRVELHASQKVNTGAASQTLSPITTNAEKVHSSFRIDGGQIHIAGLDQKVVVNDQLRNASTPTERVEHKGRIRAPSGTVSVSAQDRIYLEAGSRVDVSGEWVSAPADGIIVESQLNSVELKNDFAQKDGVLQGETIKVLPFQGSTIGDLTDALNFEFLSAREMSTAGGEILLSAPAGDIIVRDRVLLDVSGGGTTYAAGRYDATMLYSGNRIYNISQAPDMVRYDGIVSRNQKTYERWGVVKTFEGLHYGGSTALKSAIPDFVEGDDAGRLILAARGIVFDGMLDGSATTGPYQARTRVEEVFFDNFAVLSASGTKAPRGGELIFGPENPVKLGTRDDDLIVDEVVVAANAPRLPDSFGADSDLQNVTVNGEKPFVSRYSDAGGRLYRSILPAETFNAAGLSNILINANTKITVQADTRLALQPGGLRIDKSIEYTSGMPFEYLDIAPASLELTARAIEHAGVFESPNGDVFLSIVDTVTSTTSNNPIERRIEINERALLADGSRIDVAGERIDNRLPQYLGSIPRGFTDGGNIQVNDLTRFGAEVILAPGGRLDVSSGYRIASEAIEGGRAGSIRLKGNTLVLAGKLSGYALPDRSGGRISLHADTITVQQEAGVLANGFSFDDELPQALQNHLKLGSDQLDDTGFSHIELISFRDLTVTDGIYLAPSTLKMAYPSAADNQRAISPVNNLSMPESGPQPATLAGNGFVSVPMEYLGASSIGLQAGQPVNASQGVDSILDTYAVDIRKGATVQAAHGGTIELSGLTADVSGSLIAPGGTLSIETTGVNRDLVLRDGSSLQAAGYNLPFAASTNGGSAEFFSAYDAGSISLVAKSGNVVVASGASIDISGSQPVSSYFKNANFTFTQKSIASNAGGLAINFLGKLTSEGTLEATAAVSTTHGGALSITRRDQQRALAIDQAAIEAYRDSGFDDITFTSFKALRFEGDIDVSLDRGITLDAPLITGTGNQSIRLQAPSVTLANRRAKYGDAFENISYFGLVPDNATLAPGGASLSMTGRYADVHGGIALSGFDTARIEAAGDMRLSDDVYFDNTNSLEWRGQLRTRGDLTLRAARIYPTTRSNFTIASDSGRITILPGSRSIQTPIVSAGGALTLAAAEIDHQGYVAAPMGRVRLAGDHRTNAAARRILLGSRSVISVAADSRVDYGSLEDIFWTVESRPRVLTSKETVQATAVETAPARGVSIFGQEVIMTSGASIDGSGGGAILASEFLPGIEGLVDPFLAERTHVIVPGIDYPGEAVFLESGGVLPAGFYSLLPKEYAFLDGAHVIRYEREAGAAGLSNRTEEGYAVVTGYEAQAGTDFVSQTPRLYSVRSAGDVFGQGNFNVRELTAGDGGLIDIQGTTTILEGTVQGTALEGYNGGRFVVSGAQTAVVSAVAALPADFEFDDPLPGQNLDTALILGASVSDRGLRSLQLGTLDITRSVAIEENAVLSVPNIDMNAAEQITIGQNSLIRADGPGATITFNTPAGVFSIEDKARVRATRKVNLLARTARFGGTMASDGGQLTIASDSIVIMPADAGTGALNNGSSNDLFLSDSLRGLEGFADVELVASAGLTFGENTQLSIQDALVIDTPVIRGMSAGGNGQANVSAASIRLINSGAAAPDQDPPAGGAMHLSGAGIAIGRGDVTISGFDRVSLAAENDITLLGDGSLVTGGDLTLSANRLTTGYYQDSQTDYEATVFEIQAGSAAHGFRDIVLLPGAGDRQSANSAGGSLEMLGRTIDISGRIDMNGGWLTLQAVGVNAQGEGIALREGALIDLSGNGTVPGGRLALVTDAGAVRMDAAAGVDVSAGAFGDAGAMAVYAPQAGVALNGAIVGRAGSALGGTFKLDTLRMDDLTPLLTRLTDGGFNAEVALRVRSGNLFIDASDSISAKRVKLAADGGNIQLAGSIDASGLDGGRVEMAAGMNLILLADARIHASASAGAGGSVLLAADRESLVMVGGSLIDVSGVSGGSVQLRARRTTANDDVRMYLAGTIRGAADLIVEGVQTYQDQRITSGDINLYHSEADSFLGHAVDNENRFLNDLILDAAAADILQVVPGIEVRSQGDLTLGSTWDLTGANESGKGGWITLRAGGNLKIDQSLVDHPTALNRLNADLAVAPVSWGYNLVAGADLTAAGTLATQAGGGDLKIAGGKVVYTENNAIRFASGGDTIVEAAPGFFVDKYMVNYSLGYNLATYSGNIEGNVARDLSIAETGAIQSATGDIDITVKRDLIFSTSLAGSSAIRTTGTAPPNPLIFGLDWDYSRTSGGGDITLDVGGDLRMTRIPFYRDPSAGFQATPHLLFWDNMHQSPSQELIWSADFGETSSFGSTPTAGVATMGGGAVEVNAGGDVFGQVGTFKDGDLSVFAIGDIGGYYQVADGQGVVTSMQNIASAAPDIYDTSLAVFDAQVHVTAQGNISFGTIFNPTFPRTVAEYTSRSSPDRYLDYSADTSVTLSAVTGDLSLGGSFWKEERLARPEAEAYRVLPPTVRLSAGGDIRLGSVSGGNFVLAPSPVGNLTLKAEGAISGLHANFVGDWLQATLILSDIDPADIYRLDDPDDDPVEDLFDDETKETMHAAVPLHRGDDVPVSIASGGDLRELRVISAKQTDIVAGGDVSGLYFFGQNIAADHVSSIRARGNIELSSVAIPSFRNTGFRNGGPGLFLVQAGGSIDLGTTQGIQAVGNAFYAALDQANSNLVVSAGLFRDMQTDQLKDYFDSLREYGTEYSRLLAEGDTIGAAELVEEARAEVIDPFLTGNDQVNTASLGDEQIARRGPLNGDIDMTSSSIQTNAEEADIFLLATGDVNVGLTTIPDPADSASGAAQQTDSGVFTTRGGDINIFSIGDINVNESRIMTFRGGDISVWSDKGDINAGRGSKTAINAGSPKVVSIRDDEGNVIGKRIEWEAPSVGSGIRTLTYDPDGFQGPQQAPEPGDAFLFAPEGVIDAGEAGIGASNITLGATEVLNAQNIEVGGTSVGVPVASGAGDLGSISGDTGSLSEATKRAEEAATMSAGQKEMAAQTAKLDDAFVLRWLKVEFMGFEENREPGREDDDRR